MESIPDSEAPILDIFPEEPLTLSGEDGFGLFPARLGMQLHGSRYRILRKLGRGQFSSTWLAYDSQLGEIPQARYHAIKILTAYATKCHHDGHLLELKVMQTISKVSERDNLPRLGDHFEIDGPHGRHLCLVLTLFSETVSDFTLAAPSKSPEPWKVKIIVADVVEALKRLHGADIIHNDLQANNVLFIDGTGWKTIEELLDNSPQIVDGEFVLKGERYQIMRSQPLPNLFHWDDHGTVVATYLLYLSDFGSAELELQILGILNSSLLVDMKTLLANVTLAAKNLEGNVAWVTLKPEYHSQLIRGALSLLHLHRIETLELFFNSKKTVPDPGPRMGQRQARAHTARKVQAAAHLVDPAKPVEAAQFTGQPVLPTNTANIIPPPLIPPPLMPPPPTTTTANEDEAKQSWAQDPVDDEHQAGDEEDHDEEDCDEGNHVYCLVCEEDGSVHPHCEDCHRPATGLKHSLYPKCTVHRWHYNGTYIKTITASALNTTDFNNGDGICRSKTNIGKKEARNDTYPPKLLSHRSPPVLRLTAFAC